MLAAVVTTACGKKGPPLPPLIRLPVAPGDFVAERRGDSVEFRFVVPDANTDGSTPADLQQVDVYGFTGPADASEGEILRSENLIGSVDVKPPPDPDEQPASENAPSPNDVDLAGLNQGAQASMNEDIGPLLVAPVSNAGADRPDASGLAAGEAQAQLTRVYIAVGISRRGRRGALSTRMAVPLIPAPPPPAKLAVALTEDAVTVSWPAAAGAPSELPVAPNSKSPATDNGFAYHVYELAAGGEETRLTQKAIIERQYLDHRMTWGAERCYTVRSVQIVAGLPIESGDSAPPVCATITDTFPPPSPTGLRAVGSEGVISLIWDASTASDLAGYVVLRGPTGGQLEPITASPIEETTFRDTVPSGQRVVYAVRAVDKSGNASAPSMPVEETAR
jgi:hypothetical protein